MLFIVCLSWFQFDAVQYDREVRGHLVTQNTLKAVKKNFEKLNSSESFSCGFHIYYACTYVLLFYACDLSKQYVFLGLF